MIKLLTWLKQKSIRILAVFKSKNIQATMPDPSISRFQKIDQKMNKPEFQQLKHELVIKQGNDFMDLIATQYQIQDLTLAQRMVLGLAMDRTLKQVQKSKQQLKQQN